MCGRLNVNNEQVDPWVLDNWDISFSSHTNLDLRPTQSVATITNIDGTLQQLNTRWGIKPAWSKKLLINAQSETAATKKTFKNAYISKRCLVPCSGWYEWRSEGDKRKQKYQFTSTDMQPLLMAGIWYETESEPQLVTFTTHPNERCAEYHHRMPVIILPEDVDYWFHSTVDKLPPLIEPVESKLISVVRC